MSMTQMQVVSPEADYVHEIAIEAIIASNRDPIDEAKRVETSIQEAIKLQMKRSKRNAYMQLYRAHRKSLPTWAGLSRYKDSELRFKSRDGTPMSARLASLTLTLCADRCGMFEEACHMLPDDPKLHRKFVTDAIIRTYETGMLNLM